jgi:hypothetical protein
MSLRWSEEDLQQYLRRGQPAPISEKAFMTAVLRLAKQYGWMSYFTWSSKRSPEGFPDLVLAHPSPERDTPIIVAELKTDTGQCTPAQVAWLAALAGASGVVSEIWRPADLDAIVQRLRP